MQSYPEKTDVLSFVGGRGAVAKENENREKKKLFFFCHFYSKLIYLLLSLLRRRAYYAKSERENHRDVKYEE